jgi:hypothetical protein
LLLHSLNPETNRVVGKLASAGDRLRSESRRNQADIRRREKAIARHEKFIAKHELLMSEIHDKLNGLIDIVDKSIRRNGRRQ